MWFARVVRPRLKGEAHLIRYADDMVMIFSREEDARRVLQALPTRFAKYGLRLHPEKTRLLHFRRPLWGSPRKGSIDWQRPETFYRVKPVQPMALLTFVLYPVGICIAIYLMPLAVDA